MSNKIVPQIYRAIIDDVVANVAVDFEEYGMEEDLLSLLQSKWEAKLLETRVAEFARAPEATEENATQTSESSSSRPNLSLPLTGGNQYGYPPPGLAVPEIHQNAGALGGLALPGVPMMNGYEDVKVKPEPEDVLRIRGGSSNEEQFRIENIPPQEYTKPEPNAAGLLPGDEVINSDLDDSDDELRDDEDGDGDEGEIDIVFCVYDKVQRVKNKWKTVFKDGMIHINGKDYLFTKCQGEFEW